MRHLVTAAFFIALVSGFAHAGNEIGNGGDGIYCGDSNTLELLDHYEAKILRGIEIDLGEPSLSVAEKLEIAIVRIEPFDLNRAHLYRKRITKFFSETRFLSGTNLVDIPDSGHIGVPVNCSIRQIAIQKEPEFPGDPVYVVDQDLWELLSNDGRAGLILHEIIYREAIFERHKNSIAARYFNSLVSSKHLDGASHAQYRELLRVVQLPYRFAWRDLKSQLTWIETEEFGRDLDCKKYGGRLPSYSEVETAYPHLGEELFTQGVIQEGWEQNGSQLLNKGLLRVYIGMKDNPLHAYYYDLSRDKIETVSAQPGSAVAWKRMGVCFY